MEDKQDVDLGQSQVLYNVDEANPQSAFFNSKDDESFIWPIMHVYDCMPRRPIPLPSSIDVSCLPDLETDTIDVKSIIDHVETQYAVKTPERLSMNSIAVFPVHAKLPWPSSIHHVRQNLHWRAAVEASEELLQKFVSEQTVNNRVLAEGGHSYAVKAAKELPKLRNTWCRFGAYLWPGASEQQLRLLAENLVYIFVFDDTWEMSDKTTIEILQNEFVSRLRVPMPDRDDESKSTLQKALVATVRGFYDEDGTMGNGGAEVLARLIDFIRHPPPPPEFKDLRKYLDYRIDDAAARYIITCTKFSLCSTVDISSPRISKFVRLCEDHVCIANDLASFEKEKRDYVENKVRYLINTVEEVRKIYSLSSDEVAKVVTLAIQIEVEKEMAKEFSRVCSDTEVSQLEKDFVNALVFTMTGNVLSGVIMSRYGGKYISH